jgi:hypothetical protein
MRPHDLDPIQVGEGGLRPLRVPGGDADRGPGSSELGHGRGPTLPGAP